MKVLEVRNVHEALPRALRLLRQEAVYRESRNGPVYVTPYPVTTVYNRPSERVMLWPQRDANPFFHLYESLWMLAGRNDVASLIKYAKQMAQYSDDGKILHGAYGKRWRDWFALGSSRDQLQVIAERLTKDPNDRRCVLQMWDSEKDLGKPFKDVPCNTITTFQRNLDGSLDLTIFCRSNDIIWGAYGANAVHFSMLLEYMANWIECPVGRMYQVSTNWHAYADILKGVISLAEMMEYSGFIHQPYQEGSKIDVTDSSTIGRKYIETPRLRVYPIQGTIKEVDRNIELILKAADADGMDEALHFRYRYAVNWYVMLQAHQIYRQRLVDGGHYRKALECLETGDQDCDWIVAGQEWMSRRLSAHLAKA